jgi:hypothetical protein
MAEGFCGKFRGSKKGGESQVGGGDLTLSGGGKIYFPFLI